MGNRGDAQWKAEEENMGGGKGGDQEGLWPRIVQEIRRDPSWATWEVWGR